MKRLKRAFLVLIMIFSITPTLPVFAQPAPIEETIEPRADVLEYYYKVVDGVVYRRLWNATKQYWIGDWEICP